MLSKKKHKLTRSSLINNLLKSKLSVFLNYEKWEYKGYGSGNSRNGYYHRNLKTRFGELELQIPKDREGQFKQETVKAYARNTDNLENVVITLYKKGITTREIADLMEKMYVKHYSPTTISNISKVMKNEIEAYHNRKIKKDFIVLYSDATYLPVRRNPTAKEALHVIIGIDLNAKDKLEVANYAKPIYSSDNIEVAEKRLIEFLSKWSIKYNKLRKMLEGKDNLFTFMLFSKAIRRILYTNNICENFCNDIKRKLKLKVPFPNEESLDKAMYIIVSE